MASPYTNCRFKRKSSVSKKCFHTDAILHQHGILAAEKTVHIRKRYAFASFSYSELELLKEQNQLEEDQDDEGSDMNPGYEMLYLKNGLAVTQNMNDRFFLFDPSQMERIEELVFAGYEPVPTNTVFQNLNEETSLYSQISSFESRQAVHSENRLAKRNTVSVYY